MYCASISAMNPVLPHPDIDTVMVELMEIAPESRLWDYAEKHLYLERYRINWPASFASRGLLFEDYGQEGVVGNEVSFIRDQAADRSLPHKVTFTNSGPNAYVRTKRLEPVLHLQHAGTHGPYRLKMKAAGALIQSMRNTVEPWTLTDGEVVAQTYVDSVALWSLLANCTVEVISGALKTRIEADSGLFRVQIRHHQSF